MAVNSSSSLHRTLNSAQRRLFAANPYLARNKGRKNKPRVLHMSLSDAAGASGRGAFRLHQALREIGEDSQMLVLNQESVGYGVIHYRPEEGLLPRISRMVRKSYLDHAQKRYQQARPPGCGDFSDDRSPFGLELSGQIPPADIINLHSVTNFLDYGLFLPLIVGTPLVWTLRDMNPFTGGCHFDHGCGRYRGNCGSCPQLGSTREDDLSHRIQQRKAYALDFLQPNRVHIIAVSRQLESAARSSFLLKNFEISHIPDAVNPSAFRPRAPAGLRASLDIPPSAFVLLFEASNGKNRKDEISLLTGALKRISSTRELVLLSIGDQVRSLDIPFPHIHLGNFTTHEMLSLSYSAGDSFLSLSACETFDLSALEAMACGTPVIGFATGGVSEMVTQEETGLLARSGDVDDLAVKIEWMMEHPVPRREMGDKARNLVKQEFSTTIQARRYAALYEDLKVKIPAPRKI